MIYYFKLFKLEDYFLLHDLFRFIVWHNMDKKLSLCIIRYSNSWCC